MSIAAGVTFVVTLLGLILMPRQTTHLVRVLAPPRRVDTTVAAAARAAALRGVARADSTLSRARSALRASLQAAPPVPIDTLSPVLQAERDSLQALIAALSAAISHASESPLPPAFRALARSPALRSDPHVRVWVDSLDQVDSLRAPFGALGAGDPIYVALTARVNALGRLIRDAAEQRRTELRSRVVPLMAPLPAPPAVAAARIDTATPAAALARQRQLLALRTAALDSLRRENARADVASAQARNVANIGAPPLAMLAAAIVTAAAAGFALALIVEIRRPRVAHLREGEAVSGARILTVVRPSAVVERGRRQADVEAPPLVDIISESYRTLYLHLAATGESIPVVTVTGDTPAIVATVATNLAAVAAYEARSTLLVDADPSAAAIAAVLRVRNDPGLMGIITGRADWAAAIVSTTIGRDRPLDVLPSGTGRIGQATPDAISRMGETLARMERRYDFVVICAPTSYVQLTQHSIIPAPDVIVCAEIGGTRLSELRSAVRTLRGAGRDVHGVVLWDDETPRL